MLKTDEKFCDSNALNNFFVASENRDYFDTVCCVMMWYVDRSYTCIYLTKRLWWPAAAAMLMPRCTKSIDSQLHCQMSLSLTMLMLYRHAKAHSEMHSVSYRPVRYLWLFYFC